MTSRKSSKSVSYVLSPTEFHKGHSLGVNALQYAAQRNILVSAGRDGVVSTWAASLEMDEIEYPIDAYETQLGSASAIHDYAAKNYDNDAELAVLEAHIRKGIRFHQPKYAEFSMQNHSQLHTDWVNDIKLLQDEHRVVSCSSDLSVKLWDSTGTAPAVTIGHHTDYVKCLAYHELLPGRILSGSLDQSITTWDLEKRTLVSTIRDTETERGSIYLLALQLQMACSGGPDNCIRLYDLRSTPMRATRRLTGHQGNIKSLLLKNQYLLSGSADSTVKLWCLRTNRVLRTFDMHESSVWSLECPKEENNSEDLFNMFYSGDKNGLVVKTDLQSCNYDYYYADNSVVTGKLNDNLGISTVIADLSGSLLLEDDQEGCWNGVLLLAAGDNSIWAASSCASQDNANVFVTRWPIASTNKLVAYQAVKLLKNLTSYSTGNTHGGAEPAESPLASVASDPFEAGNLFNDDLYDLVSQLSNHSGSYELQKLDGAMQLDGAVAGAGSALAKMQLADDGVVISPFLAVTGGPNTEFVLDSVDDSDASDASDSENHIVIVNGLIPAKAVQTVPISIDPLQQIQGQNGLIKHRLLNNRRNVVTMDSGGTLEVWDLVKCSSVETVRSAEGQAIRDDSSEMLEYQFNEVIDKYQTNETLPMWCKVEIKAGKLFVTLEEASFGNTEIYLDQLFEEFPTLEAQYRARYSEEEFDDKKLGTRVNLGRMVLKNIFRKFVKLELQLDQVYRRGSDSISDSISVHTLELNVPEHGKGANVDLLDPILSDDAVKLQAQSQALAQTALHNSSAPPSAMPLLSKKQSNDDHKRKFSIFGKSSRSGSSSSQSVSKPALSSASSVAEKEAPVDSAHAVVQEIRSKYDSGSSTAASALHIGELELPFVELSSNTKKIVIISELVNNMKQTCFHGVLEDDLKSDNLAVFEKLLPRWCGNLLLLSKFPTVHYNKINFVIEELKSGDGAASGLAPVTKLSNKLSAVNVLRLFKILAFIIDRLDEKPVESLDPGFKAHEFLELVCLEQVIPYDMTLATMKLRIWKKSGDVLIQYRRKQG